MDDGTLVIHIKTGRFIALNAFNAAATWNVIVNFIFHWNELSFYKISKKKLQLKNLKYSDEIEIWENFRKFCI